MSQFKNEMKRPSLSGAYRKKETVSKASAMDYIVLMKPGIAFLLVVEAAVAYLLSTSMSINALALGALIATGFLSSGGSAAINHYLERDQDSRMKRTSSRPVASNRISGGSALVFGVSILGISLAISWLVLNPLTAAMIALGAVSYIFLYTMFLKPRTELNIVIGGIAGVFPALAGWAAGTNTISLLSLLIGAIVFLWTPPHFWGLATKYREDYKLAGYPMLPVNRDTRSTVRSIVIWSIPMLVAPFIPLLFPQFGNFTILYYAPVAAVTAVFIKIDISMLRRPSVRNAFRAFTFSLPYLFVVLFAMVAGSMAL